MKVLKKKKNLLITIFISVMLLCAAGIFSASAFFNQKNAAYAAETVSVEAVLAYDMVYGSVDYMVVMGIDTENESNTTNKDNLSIVIPAKYNGYPVRMIQESAFQGKEGYKFKSFNLSDATNLETIGVNAFNGCTSLVGELKIPESVIEIFDGAFNGCTGFTGSLTIPNSVRSIGKKAFTDCSGFDGTLKLPNNMKFLTIDDNAFQGCSGFTGSLTIPNSVRSIGKKAFTDCSGLTAH